MIPVPTCINGTQQSTDGIAMSELNIFDRNCLDQVSQDFGTPCHVYDENLIRQRARKLNKAFAGVKNFKNFFAVKATPNPRIMQILKEEGMGMDCSSAAELELCERLGIRGRDIMFTSNNTPDEEFVKSCSMGAILNIDDYEHITRLDVLEIKPELVSFRYLPNSSGEERQGNQIIGSPKESKFGITDDRIFHCFAAMKKRNVKRFGLHTMLASNERNAAFFIETARIMFDLAKRISEHLSIDIEFINLGGGLGIPQHPTDSEIDIDLVGSEVGRLYTQYFHSEDGITPDIYMENGRYITGPAGVLLTKVRHVTSKHKRFVGVDASMADFMRPALYKDYHHVTVLNDSKELIKCDVTGSLCENNDKFAIDRELPRCSRDDLLIIHDTGAHGYSMGFSYNGKTKSPEVLMRSKGEHFELELIRRREQTSDLFATLDF